MPDFVEPCFFFACSCFSLSLTRRVLRLALRFSPPLWPGAVLIISSRARIFSSMVCAAR